jgi:hypothetical protein
MVIGPRQVACCRQSLWGMHDQNLVGRPSLWKSAWPATYPRRGDSHAQPAHARETKSVSSATHLSRCVMKRREGRSRQTSSGLVTSSSVAQQVGPKVRNPRTKTREVQELGLSASPLRRTMEGISRHCPDQSLSAFVIASPTSGPGGLRSCLKLNTMLPSFLIRVPKRM